MDVDLTPLLDTGLQLIAGVLMAFLTWVAAKAKQKFDVDIDTAKGGIVDHAIDKGVDYARGMIVGTDGRVDIHVKNAMVALAVKYVMGKVPETLEHFGIDEHSLTERVLARLNPKVETEPASLEPISGADYPMPADAS